MILRTKSGEYRAASAGALLEFLGVKKGAAGPVKVAGDIELIASAPFCLSAEHENKSGGVAWTFSTFDLDRYGERIDPAGWDCAAYQKNPVVQWAHHYLIPAIGRAEDLRIDENGLHGSVIFNEKDYDPFGWAIGERVKAGVIRAGSVGFRAIEIEIPDKKTAKDGTALIFRKQELVEFSVCNVPANPFALSELAHNEKPETIQDVGSSFWGNFINFQGA